MSNYEVVQEDVHYVVTIKIEKVSKSHIVNKTGGYSTTVEGTKHRVVEDLHSVHIRKDSLNSAIDQAIGHIDLMKESPETS